MSITAPISITRRLARHVCALQAATLPAAVRDAVPGCVLDFAGCALAARTLPWSRQAAAVARGPQGAPSTIVGTPWRAMPAEAAFASAVSGHGLVQEDMHVASGCHVGTVVIPAVLALAQAERAGGADLLAAVVAGYDAMARLGRALRDPRIGATWRPSGLAGAFGAAAACARLLRLSEDATVNALALGANGACGVNEWPLAGGTEIFAHAGTAARLGVSAALLAREGFVASETALDGPSGLLAGLGRREHAPRVAEALGERWEILQVYFKPAPACNHVQAPVQVLRSMLGGTGLAADAVERVVLRTSRWAIAYPGCAHAGPFVALLQAKMSIPFALAAVLLRGDLDDAAFDRIDDPDLAAVAARVTLQADEALTAAFPARQGCALRVELRDGRTLHGHADDLAAPGADEVRLRWRRRAGAALGEAAALAFERETDALDGARDVSDWVGRLAAPATAAPGAA